MSKLSIELGKRIRNYRVGQKMSQEELAERCGLHPTYIGQIERGEKNATLESISKIAGGLSVSLERLFEKIDSSCVDAPDYPSAAYDLVQSVPTDKQEKLLTILRAIIEMN